LLDADDLWEPEKLERQLAMFADDPGLDIVFTGVDQFVSPELEGLAVSELQGPSATGVMPSALLMRAAVVERVGPYREDISAGEFLDWFDRARAAGCRIDHVEGALVRRRIHDSNTGRNNRSDWTGVVKDMLDRRRAAERQGQ
jgi:hypothetical protein